ncbi:MAG: FAD-binding protein [Planctomycetaceae bacterium]|nr:FAD-binding protein [Planctomycetaceae bacterium]
MSQTMRLTNFGRNLTWQPEHFAQPTSEQEVLDLLNQHRGKQIRVIGRLHAWSEAAKCNEVSLDLRNMSSITLHHEGDDHWVEVGAGCRIKDLILELDRQGWTLPSVGLIMDQCIAGACATGTHGSGRHSLSHYVQSVRLATYDAETGQAVIRTVDEGDELRAARCAIGCLGVVTSLRLPIRPQYTIREQIRYRQIRTLEAALDAEEEYPLQQFYMYPWLWEFAAQHREEDRDNKRSSVAWLYRLYWLISLDIFLHLEFLFLVRICRGWGIRTLFRSFLPKTVIENWVVSDTAYKQLTMQHSLFRHIEIEIFVKRSHLPGTMKFVEQFLRLGGGERDALAPEMRSQLEPLGLFDELDAFCGKYLHHYPICIRKILPDDTLISMGSSDDEAIYSVSFISYARPDDRAGFLMMADLLARSTAALFGARPHWGKVNPLPPKTLVDLYPHIGRFKQIADQYDPEGVFRNEWMQSVLSAVDSSDARSSDNPVSTVSDSTEPSNPLRNS